MPFIFYRQRSTKKDMLVEHVFFLSVQAASGDFSEVLFSAAASPDMQGARSGDAQKTQRKDPLCFLYAADQK